MRKWTARAYAVKVSQGDTSWNISWASLRIAHEQCSAFTTKRGSDDFHTHLIPPHQRFSIKFVCMHGYSWTCVYFYPQVQRCLMHLSQVFSCSQAIVLLDSFGSSHSQSIMQCVQSTLMMLLPKLWTFMLWPPLLLHLIYRCCIHYYG